MDKAIEELVEQIDSLIALKIEQAIADRPEIYEKSVDAIRDVVRIAIKNLLIQDRIDVIEILKRSFKKAMEK